MNRSVPGFACLTRGFRLWFCFLFFQGTSTREAKYKFLSCLHPYQAPALDSVTGDLVLMELTMRETGIFSPEAEGTEVVEVVAGTLIVLGLPPMSHPILELVKVRHLLEEGSEGVLDP